jgi:hypothetical protein
VPDADRPDSGKLVLRHHHGLLRFNEQQLWHNLIRQGWSS